MEKHTKIIVCEWWKPSELCQAGLVEMVEGVQGGKDAEAVEDRRQPS